MLDLNQDDADLMATSNRQFHEALWLSSHNRVLVDMLLRLNSHLIRYPATTLSKPGRWVTVLEDHRCLIDAIAAREVQLAGSIAEAHMTAAREIRLNQFAAERPQVSS
jgi:DNA-binding FadR family transcriptional regulator